MLPLTPPCAHARLCAELMDEEEKLHQRNIGAGSSTRSFTECDALECSWQRQLQETPSDALSNSPYFLEQWVPYLCTARGFWMLCQSHSGRATKKSDNGNNLREGISKTEHKQPFTLCMEKPCKSKKKKGPHASPHQPEYIGMVQSSGCGWSHWYLLAHMLPAMKCICCFLFPAVWNHSLRCWQPVLREGEMDRGTRASCPLPDSTMQHEKKRKTIKKTKDKGKTERDPR